jgi:hypothetical protein
MLFVFLVAVDGLVFVVKREGQLLKDENVYFYHHAC